jgi:hypothetical protein
LLSNAGIEGLVLEDSEQARTVINPKGTTININGIENKSIFIELDSFLC